MIFIQFYFLNIYVYFFHRTQKTLCASNQKTTSLKMLTMPRQRGISRRRPYKLTETTLTDTSRGILFLPPSNNIPSSTPSSAVSKTNAVTEEKYN